MSYLKMIPYFLKREECTNLTPDYPLKCLRMKKNDVLAHTGRRTTVIDARNAWVLGFVFPIRNVNRSVGNAIPIFYVLLINE